MASPQLHANVFTSFPNLPTELRLMIWKRAREGKIIEVHWASSSGSRFSAHAHPLALLSVCKESRDTILPIQSGSEYSLGGTSVRFDPEWDTLYFPYPSQCSTSYGLSLRALLRKTVPDMDIRHLALCVPLLDTRLEANIEALRHHSGLDTPEARGRNSTTFFSSVQNLARRARNLNLETLTIVTNDPFMRTWSDHSSTHQRSVTRCFKEIEMASAHEEELWAARAEYFQWQLAQPHDGVDSWADPQTMPQRQRTWGTPRVEFRTGERNYRRRLWDEEQFIRNIFPSLPY
ncbi:hypothetical protein IFR05_009237 [Cadophora sp. M221]|nr:hypothetical protein IFR05_009237 [Cadophora sp. M221]